MSADERIAELEYRLTHQERQLEELNDAVFQQWKTIEALAARLKGLDERLQTVIDDAGTDPGQEPPPPHY